MYGLTLDQAPPYKLPLWYFMTASLYLVLFCIALFWVDGIENRYYYEAIALTHVMTLGFFTHVMFGALFQMVPVILSVPYRNIERNAKVIFVGLNGGIVSFTIGFLDAIKSLIHMSLVLLVPTLLYFALLSFKTVYRTEERNATAKTFLSALVLLGVAVVFGLLSAIMVSFSAIPFNDVHIVSVFFGWLFLLMCGVAFKVVPMFYVTKEYPQFIKENYYKLIPFFIVLFMLLTLLGNRWSFIGVIVLSLLSGLFAWYTIYLLYKRRRPRRDTTIQLWYMAMGNLLIGSILLMLNRLWGIGDAFLLALILGIGFVYTLINGMLYKIVPFLTWFHLSSKMIFEAEMGQVIEAKYIRWQFYLYVVAYILFVASFLFPSVVDVAIGVFLLSSILLAINIVNGYRYYVQMDRENDLS